VGLRIDKVCIGRVRGIRLVDVANMVGASGVPGIDEVASGGRYKVLGLIHRISGVFGLAVDHFSLVVP
jgi:hypothetical protein